MKTVTEKGFGGWKEDDVSGTLRNVLGSIGGAETLVICSTLRPSEHCVQETIRESENNTLRKENW